LIAISADRVCRDSRRFAAAGASTTAVLPPVRDSGGADTISQTIGNWLTRSMGCSPISATLYEQTIWPLNAINLAKAQIQSIIARFRWRDSVDHDDQPSHRHTAQPGSSGEHHSQP
jgi:hypothetical protein